MSDNPSNPSDQPSMPIKQRLFILEYLQDFNATQAALRAGYSKKTAAEYGYQLLQKPFIKAQVEREVQKRLVRLGISADDVVNQMSRIAFADLRVLSPELMSHIPEETSAAIQSVKLTKKRTGEFDDGGEPVYDDVVEYRLADRNTALNMLCKVHNLFTDRVETDIKHSHEVRIVEIPRKDPLPKT